METHFLNNDAFNFQFGTLLLTLQIDYGVTLNCGDGQITVALRKASYRYLNASRLHLSDPSCRATESETYIFLKTSLDSCWTMRSETGTLLTFYNKVEGDSERIGNITRDHNFGMNFNCSYRRKEFLSLSFTPQGVVRPPLKGMSLTLYLIITKKNTML